MNPVCQSITSPFGHCSRCFGPAVASIIAVFYFTLVPSSGVLRQNLPVGPTPPPTLRVGLSPVSSASSVLSGLCGGMKIIAVARAAAQAPSSRTTGLIFSRRADFWSLLGQLGVFLVSANAQSCCRLHTTTSPDAFQARGPHTHKCPLKRPQKRPLNNLWLCYANVHQQSSPQTLFIPFHNGASLFSKNK